MPAKTDHLQIRLTPAQKAKLKRLARASGQDLSAYVLARVLPARRTRFHEILASLRVRGEHRFALAELNDFLTGLAPFELAEAVDSADVHELGPFRENYVAAMVEQACSIHELAPPSWTRSVAPLAAPYFASDMTSLRLHLLQASPVPFKKRNLFVDATVGDRV